MLLVLQDGASAFVSIQMEALEAPKFESSYNVFMGEPGREKGCRIWILKGIQRAGYVAQR